jgi:hypothetical protein
MSSSAHCTKTSGSIKGGEPLDSAKVSFSRRALFHKAKQRHMTLKESAISETAFQGVKTVYETE